jgi:hypothetical protein
MKAVSSGGMAVLRQCCGEFVGRLLELGFSLVQELGLGASLVSGLATQTA